MATDVEYSAIAALRGARFLYVAGAHAHYNIWSSSQISGGTPYRARAAALEAIFKRLREFVDSGQAGVALTRRHKILLDQNWRIWKMPPGSAVVEKLPGRRFRLKHARSGRAIEVRPREAAIATALMAGPAALTTCHLALMLTELPGAVADDPAIVVETLERFQREGFHGSGRVTGKRKKGRAVARPLSIGIDLREAKFGRRREPRAPHRAVSVVARPNPGRRGRGRPASGSRIPAAAWP